MKFKKKVMSGGRTGELLLGLQLVILGLNNKVVNKTEYSCVINRKHLNSGQQTRRPPSFHYTSQIFNRSILSLIGLLCMSPELSSMTL